MLTRLDPLGFYVTHTMLLNVIFGVMLLPYSFFIRHAILYGLDVCRDTKQDVTESENSS